MEQLRPVIEEDQDDLVVEAIDLSGIDVLEEDIVPCSCCGGTCNCS